MRVYVRVVSEGCVETVTIKTNDVVSEIGIPDNQVKYKIGHSLYGDDN